MGAAFGAHHAGELSYVFGTMSEDTGAWTDVDRHVSDRLMSYWVQFAATGNPNHEGLPEWPSYDEGTERFLTLAEETVSEAGLHERGGALFDQFESYRRGASPAVPTSGGN